jgi:hypothetical protein
VRIDSKSQILSKKPFTNVVDRTFKELIITTPITESSILTIGDFFDLFNDIFYSIPKEGETESHRYIYTKVSDYLGEFSSQTNVQELIDEINTLNQQLLDTTTELEFIKNATK